MSEALGQPRSDDELFEQLRPELFGLAYRMLAIAADAEDTVHEAYLRWCAQPRGDIRSPKAFLVTVVTRLCLDALDSARARRETYVGPWLPEPLLVDELGPAGASELSDSLSLAFLVVLEELSPLERAAFLLHDVFGYDYAGLSTALNREQGACRQLVARARKHVTARRRRFEADQRRASAVVLDITEGQVDGVMVIANPDKLRAVNAAVAERRKAGTSIKREEPK